MTDPTLSVVPAGCEICPNRTKRPQVRELFAISGRVVLAGVLTLFLIPCFYQLDKEGKVSSKDDPDLAIITMLLPAIGLCLGIDINLKDK